ncbi:MAG: GHKL domain-containing protein [Clostridia bacterium]|nr:GHKL domain-containing protein [Clostridia bacterium]
MTIVDMTHFFPWAFLLHLSRMLIVFNIVHTMLKDKYNSLITFLCIVGVGMTASGLMLEFLLPRISEVFILVFLLLILLGVICLVCRGSILRKLLALLIAQLAQMAGTMVYSTVTHLLFSNSIQSTTALEMTLFDFLADTLFIYVFSFVFVIIIRLLQRKKAASKAENKRAIILLMFPLTHIFSVCVIMLANRIVTARIQDLPQYTSEATVLNTFAFMAFAVCMLVDLLIIFLIDYMNRMQEKDQENQRAILMANMNYEQMQMVREEQTAFRKIRHDMMNLLTTAAGFIEIGKPEKAGEILNHASDTVFEGGGTTICSNETINTTVFIKQKYAEEHDVSLNVTVEEEAPAKINDYDLCRLLHNLMDNALHAATAGDDKTASFVIRIDEDSIVIKGQNTVSESPVKQQDGHGYGTSIIREIVKKYGGKYTVEQTKPSYQTTVEIRNIPLH